MDQRPRGAGHPEAVKAEVMRLLDGEASELESASWVERSLRRVDLARIAQHKGPTLAQAGRRQPFLVEQAAHGILMLFRRHQGATCAPAQPIVEKSRDGLVSLVVGHGRRAEMAPRLQ